MKRIFNLILLLVLIAAPAAGQNHLRLAPMYPVVSGTEETTIPVLPPSYPDLPLDNGRFVGDTVTIGTTWTEQQHNGTCGRMVTREASGWLQFCWMKGENAGASVRHIWWNGIDPNGIQLFPHTGIAAESSIRGGFPTMDIGTGGRAFPSYHEIWSGSPTLPQTSVAMDLITHGGAFLDFPTPPAPYQQVIWPKIQIGQNQRLHIVSTQQVSSAANPQRQWYISATYSPTQLTLTYNPTWTFVDWTQAIAADVGVSPVNNRLGVAWSRSRTYTTPILDSTYSQLDNDIYLFRDEDGLNPDFSQAVNLTNFTDQDTFRAYTDCNVFFDQNNYCHVAFTTRPYFDSTGATYWNASIIWHWSEQWPDSFRMIANYFGDNNNINCGAWNVKAQRPSLGQDPATGNLYCVYQVFDTDTMHQALNGMPSSDVFVSVSTDGGMNWSLGTNVTETVTPHNAAIGQSWSEICPTLAKLVDGYCHIEYVLDKDAGNVVQTEGAWTLNPVKWHRVATSLIPATPLVPQTVPLHVTQPSQPNVSIVLVLLVQPIQIPANGGSFSFYVFATNNNSTPASVELWTKMRYPDGTYSGPLLGPRTVTLPAGTTGWFRSQNVPASAPPGNYTYFAYAGDYPGIAWDTSSFPFLKLASEVGGSGAQDWRNWGDPLPGEETVSPQPSAFSLCAISPNPFNAKTTISYTLPAASQVSLKVYDTTGRLVNTLADGWQEAGAHQATFDGSNLSSGVYMFTLTAGQNVTTGKIALLK